nr:hypothetical protein [Streptomyces sp. ISL-10]
MNRPPSSQPSRGSGSGRQRSLMRYACVVASAHHPELREILAPRRNAARDAVQDFLVAHGVAPQEAGHRTVTLLACVDQLVFDRLVDGGPGGELDQEIRDLRAVALGRTAARGREPPVVGPREAGP